MKKYNNIKYKMNTDNTNQVSKFIFRLLSIFTHHLNEQNMTYSHHFIRAMNLSIKSGLASFFFFIHSIFPFIFETEGSKRISLLYKHLNKEISNNSNKDLLEKNL